MGRDSPPTSVLARVMGRSSRRRSGSHLICHAGPARPEQWACARQGTIPAGHPRRPDSAPVAAVVAHGGDASGWGAFGVEGRGCSAPVAAVEVHACHPLVRVWVRVGGGWSAGGQPQWLPSRRMGVTSWSGGVQVGVGWAVSPSGCRRGACVSPPGTGLGPGGRRVGGGWSAPVAAVEAHGCHLLVRWGAGGGRL